MIPRFRPMIGAAEFRALFSAKPARVAAFEHAFADKMGVRGAVAFPYGRSALWAFLKAVGVTGSEVVMPPYTCSVVAHAVALSGNQPRFVDIQLTDYNMDLDRLEEAVSEKTRAVVPAHIFGYPLDMDRLTRIVRDAEEKYGQKIWIVEDCAHSFAACRNGRPVGTHGDVALYGLNISKIITSIFGGMLTFQDEQLESEIREWRDRHFEAPGFLKALQRRLYLLAVYPAFNETLYGLTWWLQNRTPLLDKLTKQYHLDDKIHFPPDFRDQMMDVEASVGLAQLRKYDRIIETRRRNAAWYDANLPESGEWELPPIVEGATYSHYPVRTGQRDKLAAGLAGHGIELGTLIDYSVSDLRSYSGIDDCPNSRIAANSMINLPLMVGDKKLRHIRDAFRSIV